jgi:DNA adenine methylase
MANPILKWAGGKRQLLPQITDLFPSNYTERNFHEPFVGGGAVVFTVQPNQGTINDINHHLINFYKTVRDNPEEIIEETLQYKYEKETYYQLREKYNNEKLSDIEKASLFLYFNKTGFNGLWRVNSKDKYNVPFGRYKNPTIVPIERIKTISNILSDIEIRCTDFSYILDVSKPGDLCYFDPPYEPVSDTAYFTSYTPKGFGMDEQEKLSAVCHKLDENGVYFVLSNSHVKQIMDLYDSNPNYRIKIVQARRSINSNASKRGPINEILVTNIPEKTV